MMCESLLKEVKELLAPNELWTMRAGIEEVLKSEMASLPNGGEISKLERRHPTTAAALRVFLNAFFARHFFQVQDTILQTDVFERFLSVIRRGNLRIADIGCGPAVASLAILDVITAINQSIKLPIIRTSVVLNDISGVSLHAGQRMLRLLTKRSNNYVALTDIISVDTPFPKSLTQLRRVAAMMGPHDLCCMSYVLDLLKEELTHSEIQNNIQELLRYCSANASCVVLQDRFHESILRQAARLQDVSSHKATLRQKVYDKENSYAEHTYTFFRTIVAPQTPISQGVETRFCLQNVAGML